MKVAIICFDFSKNNLRRQPWRYIYEIAKYLSTKDIHIIVITNKTNNMSAEKEYFSKRGITIRYVKKLNTILGESKEVLEVIREENPDAIIMNLGITSFLRFSWHLPNKPIIGIMTSSKYSLRELISNLDLFEFRHHFRHVLIHLVGALVPNILVKKYGNKFTHIITLTDNTASKLRKAGVKIDISVLPPSVDKIFLEPKNMEMSSIRKKYNLPLDSQIILYFTSPLTLRGTDILIKAFAKIKERHKNAKLMLLSRLEHDYLKFENTYLKELSKKLGVERDLLIVSNKLSPVEIREYLFGVDVVALPFKIVISEIPISILEAMAMGKVVVTTRTDGLPDIIGDAGILVEPNNDKDLAKAICKVLENSILKQEIEMKAKKRMHSWPTWENIGEQVHEILKEVIERE